MTPFPRGVGRRVGRLVAVIVTCLAVAAVTTGTTSTAAYTGVTENVGNQVGTGSLAPPTDLVATTRCTAASTPSVVASTTAVTTGGTVTLTVPAQAQDGDLLLAHVVSHRAVSPPPASWAVLQDTWSTTRMEALLYQKAATSADAGTTYSWTTNGKSGGALLVVRGAAGLVAASEAAATDNGTVAGSITAPSIDVATGGSLIATLFSFRDVEEVTFSTPTGTTPRYARPGAGPADGDVSFSAFTETRAAGATGTRTTTITRVSDGSPGDGDGVGHTVVLRPAATPVVDLAWTATPTAAATGYEIARDTAVLAAVTPASTTTWTDTAPGPGPLTYDVHATAGAWRSPAATTTVTPTCP